MEECPYCKGTEGYYRVTRMSGIGQTNYLWTDKGFDKYGHKACADNTMLHECLTYTENKTMYCLECNQKITALINPERRER